MGEITLRDIDDWLMDAIRSEARDAGMSEADIARELLVRGMMMGPASRLAEADRIRAMTPQKLGDESTAIVRQARDSR